MLEGTPPFTITSQGNETPMGIYPTFVIPLMSGIGPVTPTYDVNINPVTVSITSITDGNNCTTTPILINDWSVDVTIQPFPLITATSSSIEQCEGVPLDIIFEGLQGLLDIEIDFSINSTVYSTATSALNGISILNTPTLSDISSLLSIGANVIEILNVVDAGGIICPNNLLPPIFTITINENPTISNFSSNSPICENEDAEISLNFSLGLQPFTVDYNYSVNTVTSTPSTQISCNNIHTESLSFNANSQDPSTGIAFPYHFYITSFTDANGCIGTIIPIIHELDL